MADFGYTLMTEQSRPRELVRYAATVERVFELEELPQSLIGKVLRREVHERILSL
ncbi:hypothetical protein RYJ27_11880 [Microbacterium limosum]|uniref:AMP-binding enzyme C-terminal domain-containing protein n=1 Tax=Microbacterium limosum TaxID=3079935 RepID=A0AAU0MGU0_9MICO|nr:hypothetical protein [Microbacterium sp. Y20]WOQ69384.1 hypothetical protein RYJ27_11880 [Microbacterium sp. Y20]